MSVVPRPAGAPPRRPSASGAALDACPIDQFEALIRMGRARGRPDPGRCDDVLRTVELDADLIIRGGRADQAGRHRVHLRHRRDHGGADDRGSGRRPLRPAVGGVSVRAARPRPPPGATTAAEATCRRPSGWLHSDAPGPVAGPATATGSSDADGQAAGQEGTPGPDGDRTPTGTPTATGSGAPRPIRCTCTSRRSARSSSSTPPSRWSWPSGSWPATRPPSALAGFDGGPGEPYPGRVGRPGAGAPGPAGQGGAHRGQPAPGGLHRQAVPQPGPGLPRPHPGGEPRPDAGGREVRPHQGLQVLDLRHLVDPPGHHPGHRRSGPDHPDPGPHGGDHQQGGVGPAPAPAGARARAQRRGGGRPGRLHHRAGAGDPAHQSGHRLPRAAHGRRGRLQPLRPDRGPRGGGARRRRRPDDARRRRP